MFVADTYTYAYFYTYRARNLDSSIGVGKMLCDFHGGGLSQCIAAGNRTGKSPGLGKRFERNLLPVICALSVPVLTLPPCGFMGAFPRHDRFRASGRRRPHVHRSAAFGSDVARPQPGVDLSAILVANLLLASIFLSLRHVDQSVPRSCVLRHEACPSALNLNRHLYRLEAQFRARGCSRQVSRFSWRQPKLHLQTSKSQRLQYGAALYAFTLLTSFLHVRITPGTERKAKSPFSKSHLIFHNLYL